MRILVVEDEKDLNRIIAKTLTAEGMSVDSCFDGEEALEFIRGAEYDAAVMDITMPKKDGLSVVREMREAGDATPVLFLSARDEDENRLLGLGLGADDYITKPFLPRELVLRLSGILRRVYQPLQTKPLAEECLVLGTVTVNFKSGIVKSGDGEKTLTAKEHALLKKLWENQGNIVTADSLCRSAWDDDLYGYENTLMVHIRRLREKIEVDPSQPQYLLTIRGMGYKLAKETNQ